MMRQVLCDPVSRIIEACYRGEDEARRFYHLIAEMGQQHIILDEATELDLDRDQAGEFAVRYAVEVEPVYRVLRRLNH